MWLYRQIEPSGKEARWIEILSHYDFAIEYRPGRKQGHCDALSSCENPHERECSEQDTNEPLKFGPCKKCMKHAQAMMHKDWYRELMVSQAPVSQMESFQEGKMVSLKALDDVPEPVTSSQDKEK